MITIFFYISLIFIGSLVLFRIRQERNLENELISEVIELQQDLDNDLRAEEQAAIKYKSAMISQAMHYSQRHDQKLGLTIVQSKSRIIKQSKPSLTTKMPDLFLENQDKIA